MRLSLKSIVIAAAALGAFGLAQGQLPDWVKYVRSTSGFSEAFFRPVALPGGPLFTRRPPVETVEWLAARIEATPDNARLYALRARESERLLDFAAADNDWNEFAAQVDDPAEGQLALADFYRRRLRPVDEVEALLAVGRSPSPPSERFSPANQQRSWRAFERLIEVSQHHLLPNRIPAAAYRSWLARYGDQPSVYRRYLDFLVEHEMFDSVEDLLSDYAVSFPDDAAFPIQARAELVAASDGASAALVLLEASFDPLWSPQLLETYFRALEEADRLRERLDQSQRRITNAPDDFSSAAWLFHYRRRQGDQAGAIVALQQFLESKQRRSAILSGTDLKTTAELFLRANDYVDAARCRYALYSLAGATSAEQEYALAGLIEIVFDAPEQPISVASGDFSYYRDIATADSGPGVLNGVLSLLLNSQGLEWHWQSKQRAAAPYQRRAWALELLDRFEAEFPQSEARSRLNAKAVRVFGVYGDDAAIIERGEQFLSRFPQANERSEIQFLIAEAHARRGEITEEFAAYERLLRELSRRYEQVPLGQGVVSTPRGRAYRSIGAPRSPDYARVLDRYVSRLVGLRRVPDAVRLYVTQVAANPDDPGIYARMASFLEANRLTNRVEGVYKQAIAQFDDASWSHKLGRWYLRRQRQSEFDQLTHDVVDSFSGTVLEGYFDTVAAGPGISAQLYLRLNQYAHERFPHDLTFVRNLLNGYRRRETRNVPAWRALIRQHWFYADDLRRLYFADLTQSGQLDATLAAANAQIEGASEDRWDDAARANPAGVQLLAEGAIWKASFEQAAAPALALATLAPPDEPVAHRAASLHRSLAAYDSAHTESAVRLTEGRIDADPANRALLAEAGDILADRGLLAQSARYWDRMPLAAPGDPQAYLASATVYWDYYLFDQALSQLSEGRQRLQNRSLFTYEAGAIEEGRNNPAGAIREYLQGALDQPPDYRSRQRLVALAQRDDYSDQIDQATASLTASESPSRPAIELRIAVLEGMERQDELEDFLVAVASRVDSRALLERIEQVARARGSDGAETTALLRRIEMTGDPVESRRLRIWLTQRYESFGNDPAAEQISSQLYAEHGRIQGVVRARTDFLWRNDNQVQAISVLLEAADAAYPSLANDLRFEAAQKASEAERYEQAETILSSLLAVTPFHAGYTAAMADLFARQGRDQALALFYETQIGAADDADLAMIASLRRGMIPALDRLGRFSEALDQYIELVNRFPEDETLTRDAAFYAQDHDLGDRLANFYLRTSEQSPRDVRYHRVLARIETHLEHYPEAITAYGGALLVSPNNIDLWRERTRLEERLLLLEDALAGYRSLYELTYEAPEWMLATARVHARRGEPEEAVAAVRAALIDARPERPSGYFSAAEMLAEWELLEDAFGLAARGIALSGERLLTDEPRGASLYIELATRLRLHQDAVERVLASRPTETYEGWEYSLQRPLQQLTQTAAEYFSPTKEQELISYLTELRSRLGADVYEHALLPAVRSSGPAELEARWLAKDLTTAPASGNSLQKRDQLIELQQRRMRHAELGRQLEDHWRAHPRRNQETQLLDEAAQAYRTGGELGNEFRLLEIRAGAGAWQERYATLLLERNPTALLAIARSSRTSRADRTAEFLILSGDADLAWRAVEARATNRPTVWEHTYKGLAGVLHYSTDERFGTAYLNALGDSTIGDRIGQPVDRDLQLAGDVWFYHAARYGEYRAAIGATNPEEYLAAESELRPASAPKHFELGELYRQYGDSGRAEAAYRIAVELDEDEPLNHVRLGELAFNANDSNAADEHWKRALNAYTSQIRRSQLGANFWRQVSALLGAIGSRANLPELRPETDALLRLYLTGNGVFRFDELAQAALDAGYATAELLDLAEDASDPEQIFSVMANAQWLDAPGRVAAYSRAIAAAQRQLAAAPRPQQNNRRFALRDHRYDLIEFLIETGAAVTDTDDDLLEALRKDRPALYYRLAAINGDAAQLFPANSAPPREEPVQQAVRELRQAGSATEADALLEAFYKQRLASRAFSASYFLGLADLYLKRGAVDDGETLLQRMVTLSTEPYATNLDAAALLEGAASTEAALTFATSKLRAEPWHAQARLAAARLAADPDELASVARDSSVPYELRVHAAQALANSGGSRNSLGSNELDLIARGNAAPTANPSQPSFYHARLAAAPGFYSQANLLADALAIRPQAPDGTIRLRLFEAAHAAGEHYRAIAVLVPLLTTGSLGRSLQSFDSVFSENPTQRSTDRWAIDSFLSTIDLSSSQRAAIATKLAESLAQTERLETAAFVLQIAIALDDTGERRQAHETLLEELSRRAENARRRPRIGDHLDQPGIVRPLALAGGQQ